jgi:hypothetical protein
VLSPGPFDRVPFLPWPAPVGALDGDEDPVSAPIPPIPAIAAVGSEFDSALDDEGDEELDDISVDKSRVVER